MKPIDEDKMREVLRRAVQEVEKKQSGPRYLLVKAEGSHRRIPVEDPAGILLLHSLSISSLNQIHMSVPEKTPSQVLVKAEGSHRRIPVEDILYVENSGRKVILHMRSESLEYYERMNHLQEVLGDG